MPRHVETSSTYYLNEIGRVCRARSWNCVYVLGPLMSAVIRNSPEENQNLAETRDAVESAGLRMANLQPVPIADGDRGDTAFHVAVDRRDKFTRIYAQILQPMF
jgi:hypothetical protein